MARSRRLSAAAGTFAIVVLTAALAACGSENHGVGSATPTGSSPSASQSPSTVPTTPATTSPSTAPQVATPAGFRATSVTFVSTDEALVLGTAPGFGAVVVRSRDRGATWTRLAAPSVAVGWPQSQSGKAAGVWGIRFATASHGFVFGRGLWETIDGGARWMRVVRAAGFGLLARRDRRSGARPRAARSVEPERHAAAAAACGGSWTKIVITKLFTTADPTDLISTQAGTAAVLAGGGVLVTRNGGLTFHMYPVPSTASFAPAAVAATSARSLALLDGEGAAAGSVKKLVYVSANGGATWVKAGAPGRGGDPVTSLADHRQRSSSVPSAAGARSTAQPTAGTPGRQR